MSSISIETNEKPLADHDRAPGSVNFVFANLAEIRAARNKRVINDLSVAIITPAE